MKTHCIKHNLLTQDDECPFCVAEQRDDLAMLVRKLATSLRKAAPDHSLPARAIDYLKRKGLQGSILREP